MGWIIGALIFGVLCFLGLIFMGGAGGNGYRYKNYGNGYKSGNGGRKGSRFTGKYNGKYTGKYRDRY